MARSISTLGKPMLSIFWTAASRWGPRVSADGSLKFPASVAAEAAGAGDGVAGASVVVFEVGAGAAGGTGVCAVDGAGVEGALAVDDEPAGIALGYFIVSAALPTHRHILQPTRNIPSNTYRL